MSCLRVASVALLVSACAAEPESGTVDQNAGVGCPIWMCGSNSPEIDHLGVHDLHSFGDQNANRFFIKDVEFPAGTGGWVATVNRGEFTLTNPATGAKVVGAKVAGARIIVNNASTGTVYEVLIEQAAFGTDFWAQSAAVAGVEEGFSYVLKWDVKPGSGDQKRTWKPVCSNAPQDGSPDLMGMNSFHSVVFEDDKISESAKTVELPTKKGWFNIGCAGHALAKLHLMGHTQGAQNRYPAAFKTTTEQRTAALKMIVGDYCGTGYPFSVAGQKLEWIDSTGYMAYGVGGGIEARWSPKGATCLEKPRVLANPTVAGSAAFPDLLGSIEAECGGKLPPKCSDVDADIYNFDGQHMVSANP